MTKPEIEQILSQFKLKDSPPATRERALAVIENCAHPSYRPLLRDYYNDALKYGGHTPLALERAFEMHIRLRDTGSMLPA